VPLATAALFDLGVYLTVVGATLLTLVTLGRVAQRAPELEPKELA
jgi:multicomponent K+:H+ antiporter subunit A